MVSKALVAKAKRSKIRQPVLDQRRAGRADLDDGRFQQVLGRSGLAGLLEALKEHPLVGAVLIHQDEAMTRLAEQQGGVKLRQKARQGARGGRSQPEEQ